jgi:hypothetical protein
MEDIAVSESVYHVVSSVPDFQTKLADSRPARLALLCLLKMVVAKGGKNDYNLTDDSNTCTSYHGQPYARDGRLYPPVKDFGFGLRQYDMFIVGATELGTK